MKTNMGPQLPSWWAAGFYRTLCIAALFLVALPGTAAAKTRAATFAAGEQTAKARGGFILLLRDTALAGFQAAPAAAPAAAPGGSEEGMPESQELVALPGAGGGLDEFKDEVKHKEGDDSVYRPWETRFDLRPFNFRSSQFMTEPENRLGYRHFYAANPRTAVAPNTRDRDAQSTVVMVFGLTALAAVISTVVLMQKMEVLQPDELHLGSYQRKMMQVIAFASLPWLLLGVWLFSIFVTFVANPMRYSTGNYHWQCSAMVWFILVAPVVNLLYFTSHAVWVSRVSFSVEQQAPMGRMLSLGHVLSEHHEGHRDPLSRLVGMVCHHTTRHVLLFLEALCALAGYLLITFRWGANSQFCQPEVYWTTTALVVTASIVIVFTALAFICSIIIRACSVSAWVQDFADSFWEAELNAKIARNEAKDDKMTAKAQAKEAEAEYEAQFKEWVALHEGFEEEARAHEEIMQVHADYQAATSEKPPQRPEKDPFEDHRNAARFAEDQKADPGLESSQWINNNLGSGGTVVGAPQLEVLPTGQEVRVSYQLGPRFNAEHRPELPGTEQQPQWFQGPGLYPPGTLPPVSMGSLPNLNTFQSLPPSGMYAYNGMPMPSLLPGSIAMRGPPGSVPPGYWPGGPPPGSLPPGFFPGAPPPGHFRSSAFSEDSDDD